MGDLQFELSRGSVRAQRIVIFNEIKTYETFNDGYTQLLAQLAANGAKQYENPLLSFFYKLIFNRKLDVAGFLTDGFFYQCVELSSSGKLWHSKLFDRRVPRDLELILAYIVKYASGSPISSTKGSTKSMHCVCSCGCPACGQVSARATFEAPPSPYVPTTSSTATSVLLDLSSAMPIPSVSPVPTMAPIPSMVPPVAEAPALAVVPSPTSPLPPLPKPGKVYQRKALQKPPRSEPPPKALRHKSPPKPSRHESPPRPNKDEPVLDGPRRSVRLNRKK